MRYHLVRMVDARMRTLLVRMHGQLHAFPFLRFLVPFFAVSQFFQKQFDRIKKFVKPSLAGVKAHTI